MQYAILCYHDEKVTCAWSKEQDDAVMAKIGGVMERYAARGKLGPVARLLPTTAATTLRNDRDAPLVMDGPFAETKEHLLGFYIVDCADLDEALAANIAAKANYLGLPLYLFLRSFALRAPITLYSSLDKLTHTVTTLAEGLNLPPDAVKHLLRRHPHLAKQTPESLLTNFHELARMLHIDHTPLLRAVHNSGQLLYQSPSTLLANAETSADVLGVPVEEFIAAAMKMPALLTSRPTTLAVKAPVIHAIATALGLTDPLRETLRLHPAAFMYALERLQRRLTLAEAHLGPRHIAGLLILSERRAQALLKESSR